MREAAIKKWNTRPLEDAQAAKIEEQAERIKTLEAENAKVKEFLATELANLRDVNSKLSYFEKKIISEE
jgi:predicted nuclease with TOPRIM domain